jgi:hypothetical protein
MKTELDGIMDAYPDRTHRLGLGLARNRAVERQTFRNLTYLLAIAFFFGVAVGMLIATAARAA